MEDKRKQEGVRGEGGAVRLAEKEEQHTTGSKAELARRE